MTRTPGSDLDVGVAHPKCLRHLCGRHLDNMDMTYQYLYHDWTSRYVISHTVSESWCRGIDASPLDSRGHWEVVKGGRRTCQAWLRNTGDLHGLEELFPESNPKPS
jgi:hypothetical protein